VGVFAEGLLNVSQFSVLEYLHWSPNYNDVGGFPAHMQFVALRYLSVEIDSKFTWMQIIRYCSTTLQWLEIRGSDILDFQDEPEKVHSSGA